jgi:hypothetical protein
VKWIQLAHYREQGNASLGFILNRDFLKQIIEILAYQKGIQSIVLEKKYASYEVGLNPVSYQISILQKTTHVLTRGH